MSKFLRGLAVYTFAAALSFAQSEVGGASLNGVVTDPSGAAISQAKVTATNAATGLVRISESSETGLYNFLRLPVGSYSISVEKQGFKALSAVASN